MPPEREHQCKDCGTPLTSAEAVVARDGGVLCVKCMRRRAGVEDVA